MADAQGNSTNILNPSVEALNEGGKGGAMLPSSSANESNAPVAGALAPNEAASKATTSDTNGPSQVKIIEEFQYLLEKSQHLFAGLR